jgi:acyl-CoA reductase-like NAD-dependent aldehyde dehydrogenase
MWWEGDQPSSGCGENLVHWLDTHRKAILRNAADSFKRVTLELGGKSPTIILDDADLATAIPLAIQAGFMNSGQACIAGTRILVPRSQKLNAKPR